MPSLSSLMVCSHAYLPGFKDHQDFISVLHSVHTSSSPFRIMGSCLHQHDCEEYECAGDWSLYKNIDITGVTALNETVEGSAKSVFKPWEQRSDLSTVLASNDDDAELIVFIPFTTDVKIKSICVVGGVDGHSPSKMRAFLNRDDIDFSQANDLTPVQEWELAENIRGELEYPTKYAKFQGVASLTLHFPSNFGADATHVHYIGLRGEATQVSSLWP
ncbi:uncharacterized protein [Physcomitrium patens]|uniref:uncharacterized protein isoform X2 n=1 Tax=Physcomitrium patens TaxID=3218 RepID=UPI003CCE4BEB